MREIKFRAWDKKWKRMFPFEHLTLSGTNRHTQLVLDLDNKDLELMQYTGLKDKNGKEIYEGDIVAYLVEGNIEKFEVKWNDNGCWSFGRVWTCNINASEYEVIGNIYENPELLK